MALLGGGMESEEKIFGEKSKPLIGPKLGPKPGPKIATNFANFFTHFFGHGANLPVMGLPACCNCRKNLVRHAYTAAPFQESMSQQ